MRILTFATTTAFLLALGLGCKAKKANEVGGVTDSTISMAPAPAADVADTASGAPTFTFAQRQEFAASIRKRLAGVDGEIAQISSEAKSKGGAVSDRALARIRASRQAVNKDVSRIDTATEATWQDTKDRVTQALDRLDEAIQGAQPK